MKKNRDIWADAWALAQPEAWEPRPQASPPAALSPAGRPERLRRGEAIQLEGAARAKALRKLEAWEHALLTPIPNPRPM
jgi:hypothetical protein